METKNRKIFHFPWAYKESLIIVSILTIIGFLLEYFFKENPFTIPKYPTNLIILLSFTLFLIFTGLYLK
ncbi:MAG TPA: hypothetical protein PLK51_03570, partial [Bacteroidales bacterium]|nr:hypothetical protein [Bacteroidales bacterium]